MDDYLGKMVSLDMTGKSGWIDDSKVASSADRWYA
jgi:hypothetical protein